MPVIAPRRRAGLRAALVVAGYLMITIEVLSAVGHLNRRGALVAWGVGLAAAAAFLLWRRWRPTRPPALSGVAPLEYGLIAVIALLLSGELMLAILSAPNNFDSMVYHLPRIERWLANGNVGPFPTNIHRQVDLAPGGEYLLTHLRLLTGDDRLYNLVQWLAQLLLLAAIARITAQLGGGRRAQLLALVVVATTPMVVLQASSTQNDLLTAALVATLASLVLDFSWRDAGWIGLATALIVQTKLVGLFAAAPLLTWWGIRVLREAPGPVVALRRLAFGVASVLAWVAVIAGPFLWRTHQTFGSPLGPHYLSDAVGMHRHDPAAVTVNALRILETLVQTPFHPITGRLADGVTWLAEMLRIDVNDPSITFTASAYPQHVWFPYEDQAAYPITVGLGLVAGLVAVVRPGIARWFAVAIASAAVLYCSMLSWQQWGNRLVLSIVLLTTPLAGLLLDRALAAWPRRGWLAAIAAATTMAAAVAGGWAVLGGRPRALAGSSSPFVRNDWEQLFVVPAGQRRQFEWVADNVLAEDPKRIGVVEFNNALEYPLWLLYRGRTLVPLQSLIPGHPAPTVAAANIDALVCIDDEATCRHYTPPGWRLQWRYGHGFALPPLPSPQPQTDTGSLSEREQAAAWHPVHPG